MHKHVIDRASIEKTKEILIKVNSLYKEKKHEIVAYYIINEFEKLLNEFDIYIPDIYRTKGNIKNEACIYGHVYTHLKNNIINVLKKHLQ